MKIANHARYSSLLLAFTLGNAPGAFAAGPGAMEHDHSMHNMHSTAAAAPAVMDLHALHRQAISETGYQRAVAHYALPELQLVDSQGAQVNIAQLLDTDQPLALNFIFTSCTTICPIMSATFTQAQKQLGIAANQVQWVSVSIDPEYDTPERMRSYAKRFNAGDNWHFLTGDMASIVALQKAFAVYRGDKMNHAPTTFLRAGRDQPWLRLDGLTSSAELVHEYRQLAAATH